jgi:hypothetical protein
MSLSLERCADPIQSSEVPIQPNGAKNNAKKWERFARSLRSLAIDD